MTTHGAKIRNRILKHRGVELAKHTKAPVVKSRATKKTVPPAPEPDPVEEAPVEDDDEFDFDF